MTDGAGAVLLMKRSVAMRKGLPILGVFRSCILTSFVYLTNKSLKLSFQILGAWMLDNDFVYL